MKDLVDEIIAEEFSSPDLELAWLDEDEGDPKGVEAVLEGRVKLGAVTLNEMRDALGLDPYTNAAADRPMVLTATGYVPIEAGLGGESNSSANGAKPATDPQIAPAIKAYNPDQPRVPAGNPDGGQWTSEGANAAASDLAVPPDDRTEDEPGDGPPLAKPVNDSRIISDVTPDNTWKPGAQYAAGWPHHFVPWATFDKYELQPETRQVFIDAESGPLADITANRWSKEHSAYNDAVDELFKAYLRKNNIPEDQTMRLTPAQAEEFVDEVYYSSDPRIRSFNMRIWHEEFRYRQRGGGGRGGGGGGGGDED